MLIQSGSFVKSGTVLFTVGGSVRHGRRETSKEQRFFKFEVTYLGTYRCEGTYLLGLLILVIRSTKQLSGIAEKIR